MSRTECILIAIIWFMLGIFQWLKTEKACKNDNQTMDSGFHAAMFVCAFLGAPIYFIGAVVRQMIVEDWK